MIIGDRSEFAIEFELDQEYGGIWLYGKLCYWIKGHAIGDYDLGTSLRDVLFTIKNIIRNNGDRTHNELFNLEANELYRRLNGALYGSGEGPLYYDIGIKEIWARFDLKIPVDIFDEWKIFLIENLEHARIVVKKVDEKNFYETFIRLGEIDKVLVKAYEELNKLYEIEVAKEE